MAAYPARRLGVSSESAWFMRNCLLVALLMNSCRAAASIWPWPTVSAPSTSVASRLTISSASAASVAPIPIACSEVPRSSVSA